MTTIQEALDLDAWECEQCSGNGWYWKEFQVAERKSDTQELRQDCEVCGGIGYLGPDAEAKSIEQVAYPVHVGVFREDDDMGHIELCPHQQMKLQDGDMLYTAPPKTVPLTGDDPVIERGGRRVNEYLAEKYANDPGLDELMRRCRDDGHVPAYKDLVELKAATEADRVSRDVPAGWKLVPVEPTPDLLSWAVDRWLAEVSNRPLVNKNRRTLDDTWRQVIRFAGGDPDELIGPSHDALLAAYPQPQPVCPTCSGHGMIGGPSFYAPDEGGVPCPDCNQPQPVQAQPIEQYLCKAWGETDPYKSDVQDRVNRKRITVEKGAPDAN